ncbi:MAG TPA: hypothetical protein VFR18_14520 [Terriglobia bacterium]|nr:hypothetical protein [Terriglobia bacterium]
MKRVSRLVILLFVSTCMLYGTQSTDIKVSAPPTADATSLAIAPDGDKIVFVAPFEGSDHLWIHSISSGTSRALPMGGNAGLSWPCWSPDSKSLAYFSRNKFMRIDLDGAPPRVLVEPAIRGRGCSWNRDGTILMGLAGGRVIFRVSDQGGTPVFATPPDALTMHSPHFLPDNRHFLYYVTGSGVHVGEIGGAPPKKLLDSDAAAVYSRSGHVLFVRKDNLYAQKLNLETLELSGDPFIVDSPISTSAYRAAVSTSPDGTLVYRKSEGALQRQLKWFDRAGKELQTLKDRISLANSPPMLSADGQFLLIDRAPDGNTDIFTLETATGNIARITDSPTIEVWPVWSPDRKTIYFSSNQSGVFDIYERPADLSAPEKTVMPVPTQRLARHVSNDGRFLLYRGGAGDVWAIQLDGNPRGEFPVVQTPGFDDWPQFSPDGRWIAYQSNESGRPEAYLQQFPSGRRVQVSTEGGGHPRWHPEGTELFYVNPAFGLMAVSINLAAENPVTGKPVQLFASPPRGSGELADDTATPRYNVSSDGKRFLFTEVVMITSPVEVRRSWQPR